MKLDYATIRIKVKADEEEINTNELELSDTLAEIAAYLKIWLERQPQAARFEFGEVELI